MKKGVIMKLSLLLTLVMTISLFAGCSPQEDPVDDQTPAGEVTQDQADDGDDDDEAPVEDMSEIMGADDVTITQLSEFDPLAGVTAKAADGSDATGSIEVAGEVNTLKDGEYELTYAAGSVLVTRVVTVTPAEATLANGTYNYKFANSDLRHTFMAAAEDWLIRTGTAGIPLFANAGFGLFSNRMQLLSDDYIAGMGFGVEFSSMVADDSAVIMDDGEAGNAGEYTYRIADTEGPTQWNQYLSDDSITSDVQDIYLGQLFDFEFNADKTGYSLNPSMAAEDPIPVDGSTLPSGKIVSNTWQIKIREGLTWKFNDTTDTSMITDFDIDANDFYDTYKLALEQQWFRAISGGGDFVSSSQEIVGASDFIDGVATWEEVGIKLIDDYTIEFTFAAEQSEWNVKYWLGGSTLTPIHIEQYEALGEDFALDHNSVAYSGPYYVEYYEPEKIIRYAKNDEYFDADKYFYTHRTIVIIQDQNMRFQEFLAGKLDYIGLPASNYEEYKSHPGLKRIPGATTFRLNINGLATVEGQAEQFPESEFVPEPLLANVDFKMAMYHAIDRQKLAEEVMLTSQTQMYLFTPAYLVEAEDGIPYRSTPQGQSVAADLSPSTFGYNVDAAKARFELAIDALVADGTYAPGDVITIDYVYGAGSETAELAAAYLKDAFEAAFVSDTHNISVVFEPFSAEFPNNYYDYILIGNVDTGVGGISGSALDAAGFLDTYCSDNRGYFTMNWGIDTTVADVRVAYVNDEGEALVELWSFDAIAEVLNNEVVVVDGMEYVEPVEEEAATE